MRSTVDSHPQRPQIELAIANGLRIDALAKRYSLSRDSLYRHKTKMSPALLVALRYRVDAPSPVDLDKLRRSESEGLIQRILVMTERLYALFALAQENGDLKSAARMSSEYRQWTELEGKLLGELNIQSQHIHINIEDAPEYKRLIALLMSWCQRHPELTAELSAFLNNAPKMLEHQPEAVDARA